MIVAGILPTEAAQRELRELANDPRRSVGCFSG